MRDEFSNLRVISDVGNLAKGVSTAFQPEKKPKRAVTEEEDFHEHQRKTRRLNRPKNQYQESLYEGTAATAKKDRKRKW